MNEEESPLNLRVIHFKTWEYLRLAVQLFLACVSLLLRFIERCKYVVANTASHSHAGIQSDISEDASLRCRPGYAALVRFSGMPSTGRVRIGQR